MAKNKNYIKGRAFEYKIATIMRRKSYFVIRAAGSHGVADLVAIKKGGKPVFIQCKTGATFGLSVEEHNTFLRTAIESGGVPILASKPKNGRTTFFTLIGVATKRGENEKEIKLK